VLFLFVLAFACCNPPEAILAFGGNELKGNVEGEPMVLKQRKEIETIAKTWVREKLEEKMI